ncbi:Stage III sporulation protein AF (Spore_III_AF) [Desulfosporosinus orientis DSM 765]|uniref:Stage III sporulation protein AF (Spore_III_AF) n=1 Tax=Desulfosporosinus orientis (strain ATCC 19365 / DSM 765 / NCIMB 8382 / VKM B-1628 / Singapore I) TaxID=768706 RepID=G7W856_DESOD|nr:stage III sporulation protein AF [Desulfosporosinus orientis]AET66702.1 Stage III sporulation protein AF (Spore_III_AF) [Desulfosporosinus orientis DSM 765]
MQTLTTLVRNLALILLLATFLEMLLPNKSMRGFVQMVMGLFVISAVLAPITVFLHTPLSLEVPAWSASTPRDLPAIAVEGQGQKIARDAVQEQYRQILANQIKGLALGTSGVADADVDVAFEDGSGGLTDQPKINEIKVILKPAQDTIQSIQPIIIGKSENTAAQQSPKTEEVRERIATFMSIAKEKVTVEES